jgi:MFS family permease
MTLPQREFRRSWLAIAALFFLLGFQYATWASRLPALKGHLRVSDAQIGLLLTVCGAGAAASFPLVAAVLRRLGSRRAAEVSACVLALLPLALAVAPDYWVALAVACCDGIAVACLDVAMNAQGARLEAVYQRTVMSRLHATFSGGALAGALLASAANALTGSLTAHFSVAAAVLLAVLAVTRGGLLAQDEPGPDRVAEPSPADHSRRRRWAIPARAALWMGGAMAFGTITEGAMNDWSALYLKNVAKAAASVTPLGIAVFSVAMVVARLFADGWRSRWGERRVVGLGSALAGGGLAVAVLIGGAVTALIGFACVGLGVAAVTPCVYVAAAQQGTDALALVAATGTVGLLAGPGVIGLVSNSSGLGWGMGAVAASAIVVAVCAVRIPWRSAPASAADGLALTPHYAER